MSFLLRLFRLDVYKRQLPSRDIGLAEHGKQGGFGVLKVLALGVLVEHNLPEVFDGRGGFHW